MAAIIGYRYQCSSHHLIQFKYMRPPISWAGFAAAGPMAMRFNHPDHEAILRPLYTYERPSFEDILPMAAEALRTRLYPLVDICF